MSIGLVACQERLKQYALLMRIQKPIGILLLLWPTLWAIWLASAGHPKLKILFIFIMGTVLARSAGCIINDYADKNFDGHVKRTRERPLATRSVSTKEALILFLLLGLSAFATVFFINRLTVMLAILGAMLTMIYPFMKRFTHLPQLGLGFAFSWGVPMAFAAELNQLPWTAWVVFFSAAVWPLIYDTQYAMTDREDDMKIGIKSTAILWGGADIYIIGLLQSVFCLCFVWIGILFHLHSIYFFSLFIASLFFLYQQWLMRDRDPQCCFQAFLNNHWVGMIIFIGIAGSYLQ